VLPVNNRLRRNQDFVAVYQKGERFNGAALGIRTYQRNQQPTSRFGISISQKVSKRAVVRNRIKRQLRSALRQLLPELAPGWDVVIVVYPGAQECEYLQFLQQLKQLLAKARIIHGH
jgi:ribonuclease P protein component